VEGTTTCSLAYVWANKSPPSRSTATDIGALVVIILIYIDSFFFVLFTGVVAFGFGVNNSPEICEGAILLCMPAAPHLLPVATNSDSLS